MVGVYRIRVTLAGNDFVSAETTISSDLETKKFIITPKKRTIITTIQGTMSSSVLLTVSSFGRSLDGGYFFVVRAAGILSITNKPNVLRQVVSQNGNTLIQLSSFQKIG